MLARCQQFCNRVARLPMGDIFGPTRVPAPRRERTASMKRLAATVALIAFGVISLHPQKPDTSAAKSASDQFHPAPEMQRLLDAFTGNWRVSETFEVEARTSRQGKTRQGTASFRAGPGYSLIENYGSDGSAGRLSFLALLWWDESAHVYRMLTCANNEGCQLRGTAKWEGTELVNSWEEKVDGKAATFKDSFVDISSSSFRLVSEGTIEGKTIWRVITKYERLPNEKQ